MVKKDEKARLETLFAFCEYFEMQVSGTPEEATSAFLDWLNTKLAAPLADFNEGYCLNLETLTIDRLKDGVALAHLVNVIKKDKITNTQILKMKGKKLVALAHSSATELGVSASFPCADELRYHQFMTLMISYQRNPTP